MGNDGGFGWQPIEPGQAGDWAALLAAIEVADQEDEHFSEQDVLEDFADPLADFPRGSVGIWAGHDMVAYATLTPAQAADPVHKLWQLGGVHPDYRGRGLGTRLLDWAQQAALPLHQERHPGQPLALSGGCTSRNTGAIALYAACGYRPARWFHGMTMDLSAPVPEAPVPAGVEIVGYTAERAEDARLVRNEAFRDHWGSTETTAERWAHFASSRALRPALSFLAYADREPLAIVLGHEYDAHRDVTGQRDFHVSLVGTRRAGRGRGIASALLVRALATARAAGFATASLGVDADSPTGAVGLYERLGFAVRNTWIVQLKTLLETAQADPG
jgi:mycothiol synthase